MAEIFDCPSDARPPTQALRAGTFPAGARCRPDTAGVTAHRTATIPEELDMTTILIIVLLIVLLGGGGGYYGYRSYGGAGLGGALGLVLVVLLVAWLAGGLAVHPV
jgi:hypothetical protein